MYIRSPIPTNSSHSSTPEISSLVRAVYFPATSNFSSLGSHCSHSSTYKTPSPVIGGYFAAALLSIYPAYLPFFSTLSLWVNCSNHGIRIPLLRGQRMASKSNNKQLTRAILHMYQLRDQAGNNAPGRKSMLIGTLGRTQKGVWVSFDKRPFIGDHIPYWNDNNTSTKYNDFNINLMYEKGLELSLFSSKKKTKPQSI